MEISVFEPNGETTGQIVQDLNDKISALGQAPSTVILHGNRDAMFEMDTHLSNLGFPIHGASSCLGAMNQTGHSTNNPNGVSAMCIFDDDGDYGTAFEPIGDPYAAGVKATARALENADRSGEAPEAVWLSVSPGDEEDVIRGIESVVGSDVPILGGSAADNDVSGSWYLFDGTHGGTTVVIGEVSVIAVFFGIQSAVTAAD